MNRNQAKGNVRIHIEMRAMGHIEVQLYCTNFHDNKAINPFSNSQIIIRFDF
jgi:hypothetical protein